MVLFFSNWICFFPYITCRHVSLLLWQKVKFYRLTSTLSVEPGVIFSQLPRLSSAEIFVLERLKHFLGILCPSRSAHHHHRAKSSTQCPLDFLKNTRQPADPQAIVSHFQKPLQRPCLWGHAVVGRYIKTEGNMTETGGPQHREPSQQTAHYLVSSIVFDNCKNVCSLKYNRSSVTIKLQSNILT